MARKPAAKATNRRAAKAARAAKKPGRAAARKPAKLARKRARKAGAQGPAATAYAATRIAVRQIERAYKAVKASSAALERSLQLSQLVDAATPERPAFREKMQKLQARLQTAQAEVKRLYQETLDRMSGGGTVQQAPQPDSEADKSPVESAAPSGPRD